MRDWRDSISQIVGAERIHDVNDYVSTCSISNDSPLDYFYSEIQKILTISPHNSWKTNSWVGALSSIAMVSSVENYFRQIFSRTLKICTESQKAAARNNINLGSVIWHPLHEIERGAFEHISLASSENINTTAKKYLNIELKSLGLGAILNEFDVICELRHGIVHSGKVLAGKNGIKLKLPTSNDSTLIDIGFAQFQELMAVCNALVVSSNKVLFEQVCERWATSWRSAPSWSHDSADEKIKAIWQLFHSKRDASNGVIPHRMTWVKCRTLIRAEFGIT